MKLVCLQDQYLSPVKIECEGKGDEMPTLKAIIKDGEAKISGEWNKTMKIPKETVTLHFTVLSHNFREYREHMTSHWRQVKCF